MRYTGFGTAALDVDHDADLDIVVANGSVTRGTPWPGVTMPPPWDQFAEPNLLYLNDDTGRFRLEEHLGGTLTGAVEISRGLAAGDVDGDGDLDLLVGNVEGPARLYRNDCPAGGHWTMVRCIHPDWRRDAIGARVEVRFAGSRSVAVIGGNSSFLSASPPVAHFGLGAADAYDEIVVRWPDGLVERFPGGPADVAVELVRGRGEARE